MKGKARIDGDAVQVEFRLPLAMDGPVPKVMREEPARELGPKEKATHSPGFRAVNWFGVEYFFSPMQARVVAMLWAAWQEGTGGGQVEQDALLLGAESDQQRLRDLFGRGDHPAWGTMIVPALDHGGAVGCFMLQPPADVTGG